MMKFFNTLLIVVALVMGAKSLETRASDNEYSFEIPLVNRNLDEYYALMNVASPHQNFKIVFDTAMDVRIVHEE